MVADARRVGRDEGRTRGWEINVMRCNEGGGAHRERERERETDYEDPAKCHSIVARLSDSAQTICRRVQDAHPLDTLARRLASDLFYGVVSRIRWAGTYMYVTAREREKERECTITCARVIRNLFEG